MHIEKKWFLIILSFLIAILLSIMPLPSWANVIRPAWVTLVLIYWTIELPHQINLGTAWLIGLLLDGLNGTVLGEHALALMCVVYLSTKFYQQFRMFPLWQQASTVMLLILLYQSLLWMIQGGLFWLTALTSALLWPWLFRVLKNCERT